MSIKFWLMHNRSRIITALMFCLVFALLAFAPPFSSSAHAIALVDDSLALIIAALLASAGITLTTTGTSVTVTDWVLQRISAHAAYAGYVWDEVKTGFRVGVDKLGDILTNNSLLSWFSDFAEWLKTDNSLTDNTVTTIISSQTVIQLPSGHTFPLYSYFGAPSSSSIVLDTYYYLSDTDYFVLTSDGYTKYFINGSAGSVLSITSFPSVPYSLNFCYPNQMYYNTLTYLVAGGGLFAPAVPDPVKNALLGLLTASDGISADVGTIDIPVDGTNYTDTDGAILGGIGSWGDSLNDILEKLREWLDSQSSASVADPTLTIEAESDIIADIETDLLSTDNWPGMLPPVSFTEFSFSSIWHYVTDWLAAFSGTLATVLGISFALPAVSIVYAVIVLSLTLWLLRKVSS